MKQHRIAYDVNDVPDKDIAFATLAPLFPIWNHVYEDAVGRAKAHFSDRNRLVNRYLFPCIVRDELLASLGAESQLVTFQYYPLENNGLLLLYEGYVVRSRKTKNGQLPPPGRSHALQSYFRQLSWEEDSPAPPWVPRQLMLQFPPTPPEYNLMLLWCVDHHYNFQGLWLAAPKSGDVSRVECHWCEPIPYLGASSVALSQVPAASDVPDLDIIELDTGQVDEVDSEDAEEDGQTGTGQSQ